MTERLARLSIADGVAEVTLDRPAKRNALSRELLRQLTAAVGAAASDPSTRLFVLSANGPAFCAGMDLDEMQRRASEPDAHDEWETDARDYRDLLVAILKVDAPTLAVVAGPAIAGGFGLVLACDLVLATTQARFALPEPKRGISPAVVAPLVLYRLGPAAAAPILLAGQTLTAEEAHRLGFCQFLTAPEKLTDARRKATAPILEGAPQSLAMTKWLMRSFAEPTLLAQLEEGRKVSALARRSAEAREGLAAFLEKRPPNWNARKGEG